MSEIEECKDIFEEHKDIEQVINYLRKHQYHKIDCIKIVREILNIDLASAKKIVHISKTWSDTREASETLQEDIINTFKKGHSQEPGESETSS